MSLLCIQVKRQTGHSRSVSTGAGFRLFIREFQQSKHSSPDGQESQLEQPDMPQVSHFCILLILLLPLKVHARAASLAQVAALKLTAERRLDTAGEFGANGFTFDGCQIR